MADAAKPVEPVAPAAGADVQTPVVATELDGAPQGTAAEAAAPAVDATTAPAAPAAAPAEEPAVPVETQTSKADKRRSRSGDLLKKLQFWKKDKKDDAVVQ
ncbi:hypothetical protein Slin15195_G031860 [Septoria linicola]|uniref:Uncharacterized protein n=1 Tax=Septoria linicola TaxID=215465 RepID=A0A9Q9AIG3_9PEZI|nr:hypothetical protein Slin14017_G030880 [Septoria linicola]USW49867.1 hypothetical protein Slin15195_G031860 [Septoria linicola]